MTHQRLARLHNLLSSSGLDGIVLNPGPTLTYLTGLNFHLMERPTVLLITPSKDPVIILPALEAIKLEQCPVSLVPFSYGDNPAEWNNSFQQAVQSVSLNGKKIGVEPGRLRFLELQFLQDAAPQASFVSAADTLAALRIQKDNQEIAAMRQAVQIAQDALQATLPSIRAGVSEREIASELLLQLLRHGSDPEFPFSPIVSGGPNSANPHAAPSSRPLQTGDLLVIDWGAYYEGYCSDLTRTFAIGEIDPEYQRIYDVVAAANAAGRAASRPGIPAGEVDRAARAVIREAGYAEFFTHRTGHGIGMEGHEHPYIYAENQAVLEPGMTFTVEPGIYLPGRNGVRIEDNVVITAQGAESLSSFSRELHTIG